MMKRTLTLLIALLELTSAVIAAAEPVAVDYDQRQPQLAFAAGEIQRAGPAPAAPIVGENDRIGWSADGNRHDPDDWGATAVALAIFAKQGWQSKVTHIDYNNWLPDNTPLKAAEETTSVLEGVKKFRFAQTKTFDCQTNLEAAIADVVAEINKSSSRSRFWYIQAGPFEVAYRALLKADPEKRQYCILVSHSAANDRSEHWPGQHGKDQCVALGAKYFFTTGQGGNNKFGARRLHEWQLVDWMKNSPNPEYRWVYSRLRKTAEHKEDCLDASDGGMAFVLATGDTEGNFSPKLRDFLGMDWAGPASGNPTGTQPNTRPSAKDALPQQPDRLAPSVEYDAQIPQVAFVALPPNAPAPMRFAADEIARAAGSKPLATDISLAIQSNGVPQSYRIEREGAKLQVIGADAVGSMYGGLDVAEAIRTGELADLKPGEHKPFIAQRGIKFNIPLDLRTPSYADDGDSAQANIPEMWSRDFWQELFDEMARDRYNVISLWNDNPFPSIVKVPEYPDVALNDVLRGNHRWFDGSVKHNGKRPFIPEMLEGAEVVKKMTIDEKIAFWRDVMQMAKDRGIDIYLFTWNAFLFTEEGKDGLTREQPSGKMVDYFRASVRETVKTYPLLAGMGVTAGENMKDFPSVGDAKEQWLLQTYGEGIRDALKTEPNRQFRFIHRLHDSKPDLIKHTWTNYPGPFDFSFKYAAVAHMYGVTNPSMIRPYLSSFSPACRTWLEVRNDDIHSFRWGDPQFARGFILAMPGPDKMAGFNMGPDGYCWGREAIALDPDSPRQLVLKKQWLSFMLWGRLSYDPSLPDELFKRAVAARFPEVSADRLVTAWTAASHIIPEVNRFYWIGNDNAWYPEACKGLQAFYTVRDFMSGSGIPESGDMNIREWRVRQLAGQPMTGLTPPQVTAQMRSDAQTALAGVAALRPHASDDKELRQTLGDIEAMARLGQYYAAKIDGAAELALFDATSKPEHQAAAVKYLEEALARWRDYAAVYTSQYRQPILSSRVGLVDLPKLTDNAASDIEIARNWKPGNIESTEPRKARGKSPKAGTK